MTITIEEAIKGSQEAVIFLGIHNQHRLASAVKLGNEALKQVQFYRSIPDGKYHNLLAGETEEYIPRSINKLPSDEDYEKGG